MGTTDAFPLSNHHLNPHSHLCVGAAQTNLPVSTGGVSQHQQLECHHARTGVALATMLCGVLPQEPDSLAWGSYGIGWEEAPHHLIFTILTCHGSPGSWLAGLLLNYMGPLPFLS